MFKCSLKILCAVIICLIFSACSPSGSTNKKTSWTEPETKTITEEGKKIWRQNCELIWAYGNRLIFSATETNGKVYMVANNRTAYTEIFKNLILDDEPKLKKCQEKILQLIEQTPEKYEVAITPDLAAEVSYLREAISKKLAFHGITCKD